ncbi:hypothetical protein [Streptomyces sp. NPDC090025]|uniref:hypothetical protein n=1 Tax=Streptomyces sp. NPDC090025 TaxID=3365922 RepID=UPI003834C0BA
MRPAQDGAAGLSATPIYDALYSEYRRSFRTLPGDRSGEEDLDFRGFAPSHGFGSQGFGSHGFGAQGFSTQGFGSQGFGSQGFASPRPQPSPSPSPYTGWTNWGTGGSAGSAGSAYALPPGTRHSI